MVTKELLQLELDKIPNEYLEEFYILMQRFVQTKTAEPATAAEPLHPLPSQRLDKGNQRPNVPEGMHQRFRESGFIGCVDADADLSTAYKSVVKAAIQNRFERYRLRSDNPVQLTDDNPSVRDTSSVANG